MFSPPYWGLRDYGVEVSKVWGGRVDCEHEWIEDIQKPKGGYAGGAFANRPSKQAGSLAQHREIKTDFCVKCGAWKGQLGLEPHPNQWISHMVEVCGEVKRVLKKSGSMYLNVGDTYYGGGTGQTTQWKFTNGQFEGCKSAKSKIPNKRLSAWLQPKQLLGMPWRLAIALQTEGWILRNAIVWHKPNHMPSSVKDRLTNAYEFIFHMVKSRRYFFDLDAIRQPHRTTRKEFISKATRRTNRPSWKKSRLEVGMAGSFNKYIMEHGAEPHPLGKNPSDIIKVKERIGDAHKGESTANLYLPHKTHHPKGKNPSDYWQINTKPFPQAHFAVYPEAICKRPIKSSCPHAVCRECGRPKTRLSRSRGKRRISLGRTDQGKWAKEGLINKSGILLNDRETVGWSDCGCNKGFDAGIVLDPMCGAGTTLVVAQKLGRRWIGIDLKQEYVEMAKQRLRRECSQKLSKFTEE